MSKLIAKLSLVPMVLMAFTGAMTLPATVLADSGSVNFETPTYSVGNINGQDGWLKTGAYDAAVFATGGTPASFGAQSLRISDAVTSGSFGDQTFAKPLADSVGETSSTAGPYSVGTKQSHFEMQFDIASVMQSLQTGMHLSVSPDRGDGSRMSYLRFEDQPDGIHVFFDDVTDPGPLGTVATFNETDIATISRSAHTIKLTMDTPDGPANDVVKVYIDGVLKITGTSWEDYYRYDPEASAEQSPRIVKTVEFRESGTATPADAGNGFLIDNLSLLAGAPTGGQICSTINLVSGSNTQTAGYTETTQAGPATSLLPASYSHAAFVGATVTQPVIPPWVDPSTDANFTGSGALWTSTDATWPGGSGNTEGLGSNDQWRLFEDSFTLPAGATVTSANVSYTADNAADVYLNGNTSAISTTNDTYGAVPGALPQYFASVFNAPFNPVVGNNKLDFVVRNWGGNYTSNPTGLLYKAVVNYCVPATPPPTSATVHIFKYLDGSQATAGPSSANGVSFPMFTSTYNAPFTLGPSGWTAGDLPYEASTSPMPVGSSYSAQETLSTSLVGATCDGTHQYALAGYSVGDTLTGAQTAATTSDIPNFTNLQGNKYIIVRNITCQVTPPIKVHILKYLDGAKATAASANNYQFPMTATWNASNIGAGTGNYVLGANFGGAADLYGADTAAMSVPADYTTSEVTDNTSQVVASPELCVPGKYLLNGYRTSAVSFADAATQPLNTVAPAFTGLVSAQYIIVDNSSCPTTGSLTVEKDTIGGNATFSFTGDNGIGSFQITTVNNVGSATFNNLAPGTYHITESTLKGWTQTDTECSAVVVAAGASPVCVITNTNNKLLGEIRGTKYADRDGDGTLRDGDHHRLSGVTVYLDSNNNGSLDTGEPFMVTDSHGNYHFSGLPAGTYHVREVVQSGWTQTVPASGVYNVTLTAGQVAKNKNFGNFKPGTISGMKFNDVNGNGKKDAGEVGLQGWTINLKGPHGFTATTVTDASGNYSFINLGPGVYTLSEVMQTGWTQTMHPNPVKIQSGTVSTKDNFGNTQKVIHDKDKDHDNDHGNSR